MSQKEITLTHKGWFGLFPVYLSGIDSEAPTVIPRMWILGWLMMLSESIYGSMFFIKTWLDPTYQPEWPLVVNGELNPPKVMRR